ncbi:polysaccharide deacetylase family protein [Georgenia sp. MJ206]|uniref:polysaccharide deacetylase family protein n=1 Tax=Georgenia wangjunii TaxID=3117730 RepID=UPI002F26865F
MSESPIFSALDPVTGEPLDEVAKQWHLGTFVTPETVEATYESGPAVARRTAKKLHGAKVAVIFRHDDIQASALAYLPTYAAHGHKASWYVATAGLGATTPGGVATATADDVREIAAQGHEIGAHGIDFVAWSDFTTPEQRRHQLLTSKEVVEETVGGGYVCETFAYPGNASTGGGADEVLDYFLLATTGVTTVNTAGNNNTAGTLDLAEFRAEYTNPLLDPDPALTPAKAQAWFDGQKSRDGVTVYTLQSHNTNEMSVANLDALLDTIDADPQVVVITMRELAHYVRTYSATLDATHFFPPSGYDGSSVLRLAAAAASAAGYAVDRTTEQGKAFRVMRDGVPVAYLDEALNVSGTADVTRFEKGHQWQHYAPDNSRNVKHSVGASGYYQVLGTNMVMTQFYGMGLQARSDAVALEAVRNTGGVQVFAVNTTRGTAYLAPLTALPTGNARVGEMANVNSVLYICTAAGNPGTWTVVGTQT